jgi:hypothetical protein
VTYRELAPSPALHEHVRAFFSFTPASVPWCGHRVVTREVQFGPEDSFCSPAMLGAYLEPGATSALVQIPSIELTDQVVDLETRSRLDNR